MKPSQRSNENEFWFIFSSSGFDVLLCVAFIARDRYFCFPIARMHSTLSFCSFCPTFFSLHPGHLLFWQNNVMAPKNRETLNRHTRTHISIDRVAPIHTTCICTKSSLSLTLFIYYRTMQRKMKKRPVRIHNIYTHKTNVSPNIIKADIRFLLDAVVFLPIQKCMCVRCARTLFPICDCILFGFGEASGVRELERQFL